MKRWALLALRRPRATVALIAALTLALAVPVVRELRIDNSIDAWLPTDDADLARYEAFRDIFGNDDLLVVAVEDVAADEVALLGDVQRGLQHSPGVARVQGPLRPGGDAAPFVMSEGGPLVSADGRTVAFLVTPQPDTEAGAVVSGVRSTLALAGLEDRARLAGPAAVNAALDEGSRESFGRLFPVVLVLIGVVLWVSLRRLRVVLAVLAVSAVATVGTLACLVAAGRSLNMVVSTIPALLVVLGTAYSQHLLNAFRAAPPGARWVRAMDETLRPCLLTALTTAAGLAALGMAPIPPVHDLGLFAALGVMVSFVLVFVFLPSLLELVGVHSVPGIPEATRKTLGRWAGATVVRLRRSILIAAGVLAVLACLGLSRLRVESHILSFFRPSHPIVQATHEIEARLMGLTPFEIWVRGDPQTLGSPVMMRAATDLARDLQAEPDITSVHGPWIDRVPMTAWGPDRMNELDSQTHLRWTVAARTTSIEASHALLDRVERAVADTRPAGVEAEVTGAVPLLVRLQALLLRTQIRTFGVSMAIVTVLLMAAFRSVRLALLSLVPNLLPILWTLGAMGLLDIPLNVATVTVASIAFGMVVDDTIHFLECFSRTARHGLPVRARIEQVLSTTGRPILFTSVAAAVGFAAFAVAPFRPTAYFGLLISATAVFALVCDLAVLPALLMGRRR